MYEDRYHYEKAVANRMTELLAGMYFGTLIEIVALLA